MPHPRAPPPPDPASAAEGGGGGGGEQAAQPQGAAAGESAEQPEGGRYDEEPVPGNRPWDPRPREPSLPAAADRRMLRSAGNLSHARAHRRAAAMHPMQPQRTGPA